MKKSVLLTYAFAALLLSADAFSADLISGSSSTPSLLGGGGYGIPGSAAGGVVSACAISNCPASAYFTAAGAVHCTRPIAHHPELPFGSPELVYETKTINFVVNGVSYPMTGTVPRAGARLMAVGRLAGYTGPALADTPHFRIYSIYCI